MTKGRPGASNSHRQTSIVRGRRALNAFRIDKNDSIEGAAAEEMLEEGDDGQVKSEDDEDIDSDEAFDESDEERFSAFKFSGSSAKGRQVNNLPWNSGNFQQKVRFASQGSVDEEEETKEEDEADDETHMDLSEMLAQGQSSHKAVKKPPTR
jgi:U3 small nucleolar RNA-associated protein 14